MLKKSISSILIGIIAFGGVSVYADESEIDSSTIEACVADIYESQENYYADQVDQGTRDVIDKTLANFVENIGSKGYSIEKHIEVYNIVIDKIDAKILNLSFYNGFDTYYILEYIRSVVVSYKDLAEAELYCTADASKILPDTNEIAEVDEKIMDMQDDMADFIEDSFNSIIGEIEKNFGTQEIGDIEVHLDVNLPDSSIEAQLNLDDYTLKQTLFDSQFSSDVQAFFKVDDKGEVMTIDMSGFLDFISKDGDMYLLLENMNFSTENIEEIQEMLENLQEYTTDKTYIKIPGDDSYDELVSAFRSFDINSVVTEMRDMMSEPLFQIDEKVGDTYILVPTKFACDTVKKLSGRFDPFYSNEECSDSQYKRLVKESNSDEFQMFMKIDGQNSTLGINANDDYSTTQLEMIFASGEMKSALLTSVPKDGSYEGLKVEYIYDDSITMTLNNDEIQLDYSMKDGDIVGSVELMQSGETIFSLTTTGDYSESKGTLNIENQYMISGNPLTYMGVGEIDDTVSGNIDIELLMKDPKSALDFKMNTVIGDQEIINFQIISSSLTESKVFEIEAPEKFKSIEATEFLY